MGIEDNKIRKSAIGALAKRTIEKGTFNKFAGEISKDFSTGLDKLASNIKSERETRSDDGQIR